MMSGFFILFYAIHVGHDIPSGMFALHNMCLPTVQLYMETIQDLLDPANDNISINEDPKTGDVSLPGATLVEIRDQKSFMELLQLGEAHRFAANTKLNTESSRSHAILMVNGSPFITAVYMLLPWRLEGHLIGFSKNLHLFLLH